MAERVRRDAELIRYATLAQLGLEMVTPIVVGLLLDYQFGTLPWLMLVGTVFGFIGAFWHLLVVVKKKPPPKDDANLRGHS